MSTKYWEVLNPDGSVVGKYPMQHELKEPEVIKRLQKYELLPAGITVVELGVGYSGKVRTR